MDAPCRTCGAREPGAPCWLCRTFDPPVFAFDYTRDAFFGRKPKGSTGALG